MENVFETLNKKDVGGHTEKKNGLTYLSWAWAWAEFKKVYPDATYEIWRDENGKPYISDPELGYMVFTSVKVGDLVHSMWLPVMDNQNKAMKSKPYQVKTRYKTIDVAPATMFDINTAIMRCLTKNLAMFGLGLYIYAGEDLPEEVDSVSTSNSKASTKRAPSNKNEQTIAISAKIKKYAEEHGMTMTEIANDYKLTNSNATAERLQEVYDDLTKAKGDLLTTSTADSKASTDSEVADEFAEIDEQLPF